jgi:predicted anti-sigma-YlaC factor YlaD
MVGQRTLRPEYKYAQCGEIRLELGVYVVGAIAAADRSAVVAHLACCTGCRDVLAELAGLPELLSRVPAEEAERLVREFDDGSRHLSETE